jgi:hypothetical protein
MELNVDKFVEKPLHLEKIKKRDWNASWIKNYKSRYHREFLLLRIFKLYY